MPAPDVLYTVLVCVTNPPVLSNPHTSSCIGMLISIESPHCGSGGIQWQVAVNLSVQRNPPTLRIIDLGAVLVAAVVIEEVSMSLRLGMCMVVELHCTKVC